jgi:hypothetical protein
VTSPEPTKAALAYRNVRTRSWKTIGINEDWLDFMLRRGDEVTRAPRPPLFATARHYVSTNLYASAIEEVEAGVADSGGDPLFRPDTPRVVGAGPRCRPILTRTMSACLFPARSLEEAP